jgi:hypothetical protein
MVVLEAGPFFPVL